MNKIYKTIAGVSAAAVIAAAALTPVLVNAWGDNTGTQDGRPSYTLDQINKERVLDKDGNNIITMNSISNGDFGDEKNFVGAKVAGATVKTWNANEIKVKDGETYTIRLFVHNNNPNGEEAGAVATGVKATFSIPTNVAKSHDIVGYLDAANATPTRYWDEVRLVADENVYLEYVDGSAMYNNNIGDFKLPNEVITTGALVGYKSMNGEIPGCYQYSGVVTINVKVHSSVAAKVQKKVRIKGTKDWAESVNANVGDEVEYQIEYQNLLAETVNDVMIRDVLPTNVEYVNDSTILFNTNHKNGIKMVENTLTTTGVNIGSYNAKGNAYVRFTGKVVDKTMACGSNQLVNWASATVNASTVKDAVYKDDASVMVDKQCDNPTPTPTPTPDNPGETPSTIVNTGAGTIVTGAIGAGSVVTTLGYYLASRKKLM